MRWQGQAETGPPVGAVDHTTWEQAGCTQPLPPRKQGQQSSTPPGQILILQVENSAAAARGRPRLLPGQPLGGL